MAQKKLQIMGYEKILWFVGVVPEKLERVQEIADALYISVRTVNKHMQNIFIKANSKNKVDLLNKITRDVGPG